MNGQTNSFSSNEKSPSDCSLELIHPILTYMNNESNPTEPNLYMHSMLNLTVLILTLEILCPLYS